MLSVEKATGPYSQYEVDRSEKQSVSSGSSSSSSFGNVAVSEKMPYTDGQMNEGEKRKGPKRSSFRRIFGQNEKEEKEEKKVKEKKPRTLSIFSKDKSSKNDKNEKHEKRETERSRPQSNRSESGEKRKNRRSFIFFSDEDDRKDNATPKKRVNSHDSSFSFSDNENGPERSKIKPNINRFSLNLDKIFGSEEDHKKSFNTNHNNLSDLFIPGNETPFKSHNRSRLIDSRNIVESPTSVLRPVSLVSSNTVGSDNTDDADSKDNERYQVDDNSITNSDSNQHEYTDDYENDHITFTFSAHEDDIEVINDDINHPNGTMITDENHQEYVTLNDSTNQEDYTGIINEGIDDRNDDNDEIVGVNENNQPHPEITDDDENDVGIVSDDKNHQDDVEITIDHQHHTEIVNEDTNRQDDTEITNHQDDAEITNHQTDIDIDTDADTANRQIDTEIIANNHQIDTEIITTNRQIDTEVTNYDRDYVKMTEDNTHRDDTEFSDADADASHQDYTNHISINVTNEDAESDGEDNGDNRIQKIRGDTDDVHVRDNHLASPNYHNEYEYSTLSSPASPTSTSFSPLDITKSESDIENNYRDEEEERSVRVIEKNRFHEVKKIIVENHPFPKIIEKRVIVTEENPQTRQKLEQLQATNENLVSVKTQLELKIEEQSQQIAKLSSIESVMVRQVQLVERMEETIRRLETKVQDQKEELDGRISGHIEDTVRQLECKLNEKGKELDNLRTVVMDQLQPQTPPLYLSPVQVVNINGLLPASEKPEMDVTMDVTMDMTMTRQEPREIYSKNTLVNTLVVKPLINTIVVSASIATSVLYAVYVRPVVGLIKVVKSGV